MRSVPVAVLLAAVAALSVALPAGAHSLSTIDGSMVASASPTAITSSPPPCKDGAYNLLGVKQKSTLRWLYKSSTTPSYLSASAVITVLKRAFHNITAEHNDCGRADNVSATATFVGTTTRAIGVTSAGACGASDGANTVGFGALPAGYLALTCVRSIGTSIVEIDMRLATSVRWALSLTGCSNAFMLESVVTHEAGHTYGLGHVSELYHGRLTMSTYIDGTCENQEATLGLGDMRGLEVLY